MTYARYICKQHEKKTRSYSVEICNGMNEQRCYGIKKEVVKDDSNALAVSLTVCLTQYVVSNNLRKRGIEK